MKKIEIEKNCLDLEYKRQLQIMNALIILMTTGAVTFIGTFIWKRDLLLMGSFLTMGILMICFFTYQRVNNNLQEITEAIQRLHKEV